MSLDRALWYANRHTPASNRVAWRKPEIDLLESLLGKATLAEMCARLGRKESSVVGKLRSLGYRVKADVNHPLGPNASDASKIVQVPYQIIWRAVRAGRIPATRVKRSKDFRIPWAALKRFQKSIRRIQHRRQRALARITEPTITKQEFMRLVGIAETQGTRYLQYGIVRGWKIPCLWTDIGRERWEWRVSKADALRVKRLRESGQLRLNTKSYRAHTKASTAVINQIRREKRLGLRRANGPRNCPVQGEFSVAQIAQQVNLSEAQVYSHVKLGRLVARRVKVGRRTFIVIPSESLPPYLEWCQREKMHTGPLRPREKQIQQVRRAHRLTITDAAARYHLPRSAVAAAVFRGDLPSQTIAGIRALRARDVRRYAKRFKRKE